MNRTIRNREILTLLSQQGELTVDEACSHFQISPATARRAFTNLAEEGRVEKFWGGIRELSETPSSLAGGMGPTRMRLEKNADAKRAIAREAAKLVPDDAIVFIDGGTTTLQIAPLLAERPVRIITNSLLVAYEIDRLRSGSEGAEVFMSGGFLYPRSALTVGPEAVAAISRYKASLAFLSTGGIDAGEFYNNHHLVVETEKAMLENAKKTYVLADSSKFGHREMIHQCGLSDVEAIITEALPEDRQIAPPQEKVILAE
jgi:DeoR/GlpR family transcriptional regulator of sugar metabolism